MPNRILLISDVHANLNALEAVLAEAGACDQVWCLGDVVGYGPQPNECIQRLREFDLVCLAGNHDLAAVERADLADFTRDARTVLEWTRAQLTAGHREWLQSLPARPLAAGPDLTLVHASLRDPVWGYITDIGEAKAALDALGDQACLYGHTHYPAVYYRRWDSVQILEAPLPRNAALRLHAQMLVNPGSVGQPRDEDPRAAYALLDLATLTLTPRRVLYDVSATQQRMKQLQFPGGLIRRLRFGQ